MPHSDDNKTTSKASNNISTSRSSSSRGRRRSRTGWRKWLKKFKRWFSFRILFLTILVALIIASVTLAVLITEALADFRASQETFERVLSSVTINNGTDLTLDDLNRLQFSAEELSEDLSILRGRLSLISVLVDTNNEWAINRSALDIAQELIDASQSMLDGVQPTLTFMVADETDEAVATRISSGERVVELLELGQGNFLASSTNLRVANTGLNDLNLDNISPTSLLQVEELREYHRQLVSINEILVSSPDLLTTMLGLDAERSYLVLAQNNDEIRPSGGYISTYGWFTVRSSRIIDYDYQPTTATSPNPPSANFLSEQNIVIPDWWISYQQPVYAAWDGSWFADFPSTADMALAYYNAGNNPQSPIDGVLSIDISGFELMLNAVEDVFVADYNVVVTPNNFRDLVYDIRAFGAGTDPHKRFVAAIYQAIFEELSELGTQQTPAFLGAILQGFQQGHIMLYFEDDALNTAVDTLGWSGRQSAGIDHDYILLADANLGNKSNNSIDEAIFYDVEILSDATLNSRLTIGFEYFDEIASSDPAIDPAYHGALDYRSLLQIFLPVGIEINDTSNIEVYQLLNNDTHTQFITRSLLEYDSSERYQLFYSSPPLIDNIGELQRYRLLIQNQAGSRAQLLNVQITLPTNAQVIQTSPEADASYTLEQPIIDFRLALDGDVWVEVIYLAE